MSKVAHIERKEEKELPVREPARRFGRMLTPFEDIDRVFDRMWEGFGPRWMSPLRAEWPWTRELEPRLEYRVPRVDVIDRDEAVVVHAELPGVEKKDLDVSVTENTLTLRATTGHEEKEEKGDYYRAEIVRGEFLRTLPLPAAVDSEHAKATFKDGILELTLPKLEVAKRRTIQVE
jgi:HSP20 family protein